MDNWLPGKEEAGLKIALQNVPTIKLGIEHRDEGVDTDQLAVQENKLLGWDLEIAAERRHGGALGNAGGQVAPFPAVFALGVERILGHRHLLLGQGLQYRHTEDRKSTRLNSS